MSLNETYTYLAPTKPLRDFLRLSTFAALVGGVGATTARIFASTLPGGCDVPAVAFHRIGGTADNTVEWAMFQWDVYGTTPEEAESTCAALATFLATTPPKTRLSSTLVFEGPAQIIDTMYLPVQINRAPRQVLRTYLALAAY